MSRIVSGFKDWGSDPDTRTSLKKSGKVAAISGTCCLFGGILFGPAGIGVGAIGFGISFYLIDRNSFISAGYSLGHFLRNGKVVDVKVANETENDKPET